MSTAETNLADLAKVAHTILATNKYMTLGTADEAGRPWVSPVYYAAATPAELYWVSAPDARHSRNLAERPELSIVVFDSQVPLGGAQAVYMSGTGEWVSSAELPSGIEIFSRISQTHGGREWTAEDVRPPAPYRLYRATIVDHWVLDPARSPDRRLPVSLA